MWRLSLLTILSLLATSTFSSSLLTYFNGRLLLIASLSPLTIKGGLLR